MACKYILTLNGVKVTEVNTEAELDNYIKKNFNTLTSFNKFRDIVFDETNTVQSDVKSQLLNAHLTGVTSTVYNDVTQQNEVTAPKKMSITKGIATWRVDGKRVVPEFKEDEYIKNEVKRFVERGIDEREALEQVTRDVKNFNHLAKIGDKVHKVAEMFFSSEIDNNDIYSAVDLPYGTISNLISSFETLKSGIQAGKHYEFIPELTLETTDPDSDPLIGRLDLVAIDERGNAHLYDFKISTKHYSEWSSAKRINVDYQLAAYRGLLANKGIPVRDMSLNIVPIIISDPDYDSETFSSFRIDSVENRMVTNSENLRFPDGKISRVVSAHIKPNIPRVEIDSSFAYNVSKYSEIAFGKMTSITPEDFLKKYVRVENGVYKFRDFINKEGKDESETFITAPSKAEIFEKIKTYLKEKEEFDQEGYYVNLWNEFKKLKFQGKKLGEKDPFRFKNSNIHAYLATVFSSYIDNPDFEMLEDIPELTQLGIYAFVDKGSGIINFVTLTNTNLDQELNLQYKYNSVLSNLLSSARSKKYKNVLSGIVGNAKLLETMLAINGLARSLSTFKIGNIQVVNHKTGQSRYADINQLKTNFGYLSTALGIENHLETQLSIADPIEAIKVSLLQILNKDRTENNAYNLVYDLYSSSNLNNMTGEYKIKLLRQLQEYIKLDNPNAAYNSYDFSNDHVRMYHKIGQIILHYENVYFNTDHDIRDFGINFNTIKDTMAVTGYYTSNPEMINNPIMKKITDLAELGFQKVRIDYHDYKEESLKRVLKLYKSKGMGKASRWTFQNATSAFDHMFERDENGNIKPNFRVKNPYDMSNDLYEEERVWLKSFLFTINRTRTGFEDITSEKELIESEAGKDLIATKHYFDVPLLRGSLFTQLKNKSYKDWIVDKWNEEADIRRITQKQEEIVTSQKREYTEMYNFLQITEAQRLNLLEEKPVTYWETNLEMVEDVFAHASIRKKHFDTVLPMINTLKYTVGMWAYDTNVSLDDLSKQIDLYIRTVIFNEPGPKNTQVLKAINTFATVSRSAMLGLNPNSLIREPIQGFYMLMSRAATRVMGTNSFTVKDAVKAYRRFITDMGGPLTDDWTMLEHLNHLYGMTQMDVNGLAYMLSSDRKGARGLIRRAPYWATTAPDFLNRMTFLTAQMYHDGAMEAHTIVDGRLVYDWKKDKRFNHFASKNTIHPDYNKQKSDYIAHVQQFNKEGFNIKLDLNNPEALPMAYTIAEKRNIKSSSDSLFGYMDHENAMAVKHTLMGKLFSQFQMYFSSTKERWLLGGTDQTPKGEWRQKTNENGELLYYKEVVNENGEIELIETTEQTDLKAEEWTGRFIEGMANSVIWYFGYLFKTKFKNINPEDYEGYEHLDYRKKNVAQFGVDIAWKALMMLLLSLILKQLTEDSGGDIDKATKLFLTQALGRSTDELSPAAAVTPILFLQAPSLEFIQNLYSSFGKVVKGSSTVGNEIVNNVAVIRFIDRMFD